LDSQNALLESTQIAPAPAASGGIFKKRAKTNSAQKGLRKPTAAVAAAPVAGISDDDSDYGDSDEEQQTRSTGVLAGKKRKRGGMIQAGSARKTAAKEDLGVSYDVNKSSDSHIEPKNQATAVSAEFSEFELLGRTQAVAAADSSSDNLYRGQKGYRSLVQKREQITTKYNSVGPQKAASNIRMTTVTDYAPGMCPLR
jgi:hypothetical protein